jgi:hypothetical protein
MNTNFSAMSQFETQALRHPERSRGMAQIIVVVRLVRHRWAPLTTTFSQTDTLPIFLKYTIPRAEMQNIVKPF